MSQRGRFIEIYRKGKFTLLQRDICSVDHTDDKRHKVSKYLKQVVEAMFQRDL